MSAMALTEIRERLVERHRRELAAVDQVIGLAQAVTVEWEAGPERGARIENSRSAIANSRGGKRQSLARPTRSAARVSYGEALGLGVDPRSLKSLEAAAKLPAEFGAADMRRVLGWTDKGATGTLHRWKARGWIERLEMGRYRRTAKWPLLRGNAKGPSAVPEKRIRIEGLDEAAPATTRAELEGKLQEALKARDSAVRGGQETLARIQQDKVDKLQGQLEGMK